MSEAMNEGVSAGAVTYLKSQQQCHFAVCQQQECKEAQLLSFALELLVMPTTY